MVWRKLASDNLLSYEHCGGYLRFKATGWDDYILLDRCDLMELLGHLRKGSVEIEENLGVGELTDMVEYLAGKVRKMEKLLGDAWHYDGFEDWACDMKFED